LAEAAGQDPESFFVGRDFRGLRLKGIDISGVNLGCSNLRGTRLRYALLGKKIRIEGAIIDATDRRWLISRGYLKVRRLRVFLLGSFAIQAPDGTNLTPKGQKAKALLALIAASERGSRSRTWLCDKLWSDRHAEQALASLRQTLTEIRRSLGIWADDLLRIGRYDIRLNLGSVQIDALCLRDDSESDEADEILAGHAGSVSFLEGIDVRDPEFEEWLAAERCYWEDLLTMKLTERRRLGAVRLPMVAHHRPRMPRATPGATDKGQELRMFLLGSLRVLAPDGTTLTPKRQKAKALLALIATSERGSRSRTWLCDKLWSDKRPEQALISLRQTLTEIRQSLGIWANDLLQIGRYDIRLNPGRVKIDLLSLRDDGESGEASEIMARYAGRAIFLEGIDVQDREFEEWLLAERVYWTDLQTVLLNRYSKKSRATTIAAPKKLQSHNLDVRDIKV
jgi:DNA-binding SARP family transcriptional activator